MNKTRTWCGKIFILLLAAALTFTPSAPASAAAPEYDWYGNGSATTFTISSAEELLGLANLVNSADSLPPTLTRDNFENKTITLENDINLSGITNWTPIGNRYSNTTPADDRSFLGTFDGNNKKITGMNINQSTFTTEYVGLFGVVHAGTVKKLVVNGNISLDLTTTATSFQVGGVVGLLAIGSTAENCGYIGNLTADITNSGSGGIYIGGVVGRNSNSTVKYCYNTGNIAATTSNSTTNGHTRVGGVVGDIISNTTPGSTIKNCYNTGNVDVSKANVGNANAGGVVGELILTSTGSVVKNCYNTGSVQSSKTDSTSGNANAGGVVGRIAAGVSSNGSVENCVSLGLRVAASIDSGGTGAANVGRVAGSTLETGTYLSNNKARSDMKVIKDNLEINVEIEEPDDVGHDKRHGESIDLNESDESGCGGGGCNTVGAVAMFVLPALIPLFRRK